MINVQKGTQTTFHTHLLVAAVGDMADVRVLSHFGTQ